MPTISRKRYIKKRYIKKREIFRSQCKKNRAAKKTRRRFPYSTTPLLIVDGRKKRARTISPVVQHCCPGCFNGRGGRGQRRQRRIQGEGKSRTTTVGMIIISRRV